MKNTKSNIEELKTVVAKASFVRCSPRKLRLVANAVRGMDPVKVIDYLSVTSKRAATPLLLVFKQAVANAKNNFQLSPAGLKVVSLMVEEGPRGPKRMDKSHGARFHRGIKRRRMAHITLKLVSKEK